jgi:hypothetical protein
LAEVDILAFHGHTEFDIAFVLFSSTRSLVLQCDCQHRRQRASAKGIPKPHGTSPQGFIRNTFHSEREDSGRTGIVVHRDRATFLVFVPRRTPDHSLGDAIPPCGFRKL